MARSRQIMTVFIAVTLILMIGLSGCGAPKDIADTAQSQQVTENKDKPSEEQGDASNSTRIVRDEFGEVKVPTDPQRIAGVYLEDYLVALGITPIVQWYHPTWGIQEYLKLDVPQFDISGSIEAMLEESPDLIFVDGAADAAKYETYSKVAPTYRVTESVLQDPREILKTIANVLGMSDKANQVLRDYDQKVSNAKAKLKATIGDETVAVMRLNIGDKSIALFGINNRFVGNILYKELELKPNASVRDMEEFQAILSEEMIPKFDADHIILLPSNGSWTSEENKEAMKILDSSLWKLMRAVKKGNVYMADRSHWQTGAITADMLKVDDLLKWFVK
ncbi:ABC transporter substrate-binding protein [Paenibacillus sp. N3/727]|uniref:ABC transporter substrate-binding protein n=1 Tax=Paenibacillus sp. N3/727 TaxID=2925845 RepID=UPI001F537ED7|nr:ABC transporter substrate-binding protein [Paenibacillus sp. N3/727]UNK16277.1 ABC transporter substrate-binding protein [Paenibacillus sp. N3/727]